MKDLSNADLNVLVGLKVDMREHNFENIRIRDTSLICANFLRCNFNGSNFDNVDTSGMNLNQAQLFKCKWKNIKIHELHQLDGHTCCVQSIYFSPNGTILASGGRDNSIRLLNIKTGQENAKLDGHTSNVYSVCFSPDSTTLASSSADNTIRLWDAMTGLENAKLDDHTSDVQSVCFSPDSTISGSADNSISLLDVKTKQQEEKLNAHTSIVYSVCFSPDGSTLASGSYDILSVFGMLKQHNPKPIQIVLLVLLIKSAFLLIELYQHLVKLIT
ncbi:unnamed protein product [Paramecium primaurelia]|uniref:Uncharacterized protein n=1 Tax=Paramecium primaurelia TaxID=5886 RepID=A0A8S1NEN2_PARPR|nr:unnamed protein product [Paramecium primaurelia]